MSSIKAVMVVKQSAAKEIMEELAETIAEQPGLVIKIEKDAIFNSIFDIDTETVDIDIDDDVFLFIAKKAFEKNITFNQMITEILMEQIKKEEFIYKNKGESITPKSETSYSTNKGLDKLVDDVLSINNII